ncbi:unnamed protein product [Caretta caretta]
MVPGTGAAPWCALATNDFCVTTSVWGIDTRCGSRIPPRTRMCVLKGPIIAVGSMPRKVPYEGDGSKFSTLNCGGWPLDWDQDGSEKKKLQEYKNSQSPGAERRTDRSEEQSRSSGKEKSKMKMASKTRPGDSVEMESKRDRKERTSAPVLKNNKMSRPGAPGRGEAGRTLPRGKKS